MVGTRGGILVMFFCVWVVWCCGELERRQSALSRLWVIEIKTCGGNGTRLALLLVASDDQSRSPRIIRVLSAVLAGPTLCCCTLLFAMLLLDALRGDLCCWLAPPRLKYGYRSQKYALRFHTHNTEPENNVQSAATMQKHTARMCNIYISKSLRSQ